MKSFFCCAMTFILFSITLTSDGSAKEIILKIGKEKYLLTPFTEVRPHYSFYGEYSRRSALTSGERLYLFPDHKFFIVSWCDICMNKVVARGTFIFDKGRITLNYEFMNKELKDQIFSKTFLVFSGSIHRKDFNYGFETILLTEDGMRRLGDGKKFDEYLRRTEKYYDWQAISDELTQSE